MKYLLSILLFGIVIVSAIPKQEVSARENDVIPESSGVTEMVPEIEDSDKTVSKDELEGAESAYFGFPYYYPYVYYRYPVIIYK